MKRRRLSEEMAAAMREAVRRGDAHGHISELAAIQGPPVTLQVVALWYQNGVVVVDLGVPVQRFALEPRFALRLAWGVVMRWLRR